MQKKYVYNLIMMIVTGVVCIFMLAVSIGFAWFTSNSTQMVVVVGDVELEPHFYRLRDGDWDGDYDFEDFITDAEQIADDESESSISAEDFTLFNALLASKYAAANAGATLDVTSVTQVNSALGLLSESERFTYIYNDFTNEESNVFKDAKNTSMGSIISYKVRIFNKSDRAVTAELSFSNLMKYYYNSTQLNYFNDYGTVINEIENGTDAGMDIKRYAAKYLFSIEYDSVDENEQPITINEPLWKHAQGETFMSKKIEGKTTDQNGDITINYSDLDFRLVFDAGSEQAEYRNALLATTSQCYFHCYQMASSIVTDAPATGEDEIAEFVESYISAMNSAEMLFLFSTDEGVQTNDLRLKIDYIQILGIQNNE